MSWFTSLLQEVIVGPLLDTWHVVVGLLPNIVIAIAILVVGWLAAVVLRKIVSKLLKAIGFNVISDRIGFTRFLQRGGITDPPSRILGHLVYWIIIFSMLIAIFGVLKLTAVSDFLTGVLSFIPRLVVSLVILGLGVFLGRFLGRLVERSSQLADLPFAKALGIVTRYGVVVVALFGILDYLKLSISFLSGSFTLVFIVVPIVIALAILIGGRSLLASMLAGRSLMRDLKTGDRIRFDSVEGEIISIDFVTTKIRCPEGEIIIPNGVLASKVVKRLESAGKRGNGTGIAPPDPLNPERMQGHERT